MPRKAVKKAPKKSSPGSWGVKKRKPDSATIQNQLAAATKLRSLADMTEREIRALEKLYGCPVIRPARAPGATRRRAAR